jgi:hypothetical protein
MFIKSMNIYVGFQEKMPFQEYPTNITNVTCMIPLQKLISRKYVNHFKNIYFLKKQSTYLGT